MGNIYGRLVWKSKLFECLLWKIMVIAIGCSIILLEFSKDKLIEVEGILLVLLFDIT
jgi:hypothetical protein